MMTIMILSAAVVLLTVLLFFEKKGKRAGVIPVKTALSLLFVFAALAHPHLMLDYALLLIAGLVFCLIGDVFLALPRESAFTFGLFAFLLGHVFYTLAFFQSADSNIWTWAVLAVAAGAGIGIFRWLGPSLGSMKIPVLAYIVVITWMLVGAATVLGDSRLMPTGRIMVFAGALAFYVSDIFVARDRFIRTAFTNRLFGLPIYYAGQFLLAFSAGVLG